MALRQATADDWAAVVGQIEPADWFGLVEARPNLIEGIGAVYRSTDGLWWLMFHRTPGIKKTKTAHRAAKQLLAMAAERNITVHALAEPGITGAEVWIERLGFRRTDDTRGSLTVWALNS